MFGSLRPAIAGLPVSPKSSNGIQKALSIVCMWLKNSKYFLSSTAVSWKTY